MAFAAGHRPCAECRHADYQRFKEAWAVGVGAPHGADEMDAVLHADRLEGRVAHQRKRTYWEQLATLPEGAFIRLDRAAWLLRRGQLLEWSAGGYRTRRQLLPAASRVEVLPPHSLVAVLRTGHQFEVHPSAGETAGRTAPDVQRSIRSYTQ